MTRLYEILSETTAMFRRGDAVQEESRPGLDVTHIYAMPHVADAAPSLERVDLHFVEIGVDRAKAEAIRADFINILNSWPAREELAGGPSYIAVGAIVGSQSAALQMFALGKVLGLWQVITPAMFGLTGREADDMAGAGYVMITGYRPAAREAA